MSLKREDKVKLLLLEQEAHYRKAEKSLAHFTKAAWNILEPSNELQWNWHHDLICEYLEASYLGQIKRLIINMPPRNMKSILVSICFPAWCWVQDASFRFLCGSYSQSLSSKHSVDTRSLIESEWYQERWGKKVFLSSDQNMKTEFMNTARGHRIATSILGTATGKGGDFVLADDPHDTTGAASDVERKKTIETFRQKFMTRLDNKKEGRVIVVMQRLHEEDLTGSLMQDGDWTHLSIPAIAEEDRKIIFPISKKVIEQRSGDVLHPSREDIKVLDSLKKSLGSRGFAGQYQQRPAAQEGNIIKRHWLKYYSDMPGIRSFDQVIQSWDMTFTGKATSDFVVGQVWGRIGADRYLIDQVRGQFGMTETIQAIMNLSKKWPQASLKLIENKANGPAVEDMLKKSLSGMVLWEPQGDKVSRLNAVAPQFESGNVYFPEPHKADWVSHCLEEIFSFPNAAHDDCVDAMTMALLRLDEHGGVGKLRILIR